MAPIATRDLDDCDLYDIAGAKVGQLNKATANAVEPATFLDHPIAWDGAQYSDSSLYTYVLTAAEIDEVEKALKYSKEVNPSGHDLSRQEFPLPTLGFKLAALSKDLHDGKGFCNIRGLNPDHYSSDNNTLIYIGISTYIGETWGKQDEDGYILAHVRDAKASSQCQEDRPFRDSTLKLPFHNDGYTDILGMQTRSCAPKGGNHILASTWKIYNEMIKTRPEFVKILMEPNWYFDLRGRYREPEPRPILFFEDGRLIMNFVRYLLLGLPKIPRSQHLPKCTPEQVEALDFVQSLAEKHQLVLDMQPGDMFYLNNWAILHSREHFDDTPDQVRYLVRTWVKNKELAWKLPKPIQPGNDVVFFDTKVKNKWNIQPQPRIKFESFQALGI